MEKLTTLCACLVIGSLITDVLRIVYGLVTRNTHYVMNACVSMLISYALYKLWYEKEIREIIQTVVRRFKK